MSMKPYGYPALCRVASTAILGVAVWLGAALMPVEKLGALGAPERLLASLVVAVLWLIALGRAPVWLVGREEARPAILRRLELHVGFAALGIALACLLPFLSYDWSRALWRSRFLLFVHVLVSAAVFCALFLRRDLGRPLFRRLQTGTGALVALGASACVLVLFAESILDWTLFRELRFVPDHASIAELAGNFTLNALLVGSVLGFVWGLTDRMGLAVLATGSSYVGLAICNALKLDSLREPVHVLDVHYLGELGSVLRDFLPAYWLGPVGAIGLVVLAGVIWLAHPLASLGASADPQRNRLVLAASGLTVLLGLTHLASLQPRARQSWLPWQGSAAWDARQASLAEGMLFHLLGDAFAARVPEPEGYSADELGRIRAAVPATLGAATPGEAWGNAPNVVILMVESWMDPAELPVTFSVDPTPELHRLMAAESSGKVRSPVFGSGSANAEFELLTGLSMEFLPVGSLPYRQYIRRDLPALPRLFRDHGHRTVGILVDPPSYFARPATYPRLGFDEVVWLSEESGVARDASGRWANDRAVADRILDVLAADEKAFVFAFTNATHAPYSQALYPGSDLVVVDAPASGGVADELGGYANALREMDRAIGTLTRGLEALDEPTLLVVLGDHLPPLESFSPLGFFEGPESDERMHAVPILLWSNFDLPASELGGEQSRVGLEILEGLQLEPNPLLHVMRAGKDEERRLVQYDVLFGAPPHEDWF